MNLPAVSDPVPLVAAEDGRVIRVGGTRVTLDTVIGAFKRGATPEEIAQDCSAVSLADVYAVIAYYLRHRSEVEATWRGVRASTLSCAARSKADPSIKSSASGCSLASNR